MQKCIFKGIGTALITPFRQGRVDYKSLGNLIEFQIEGGADAIIVCGTTGEAPSLTIAEQESVIKFAIRSSNGRIPVIAGVGCNDVKKAIRLSEYASSEGADGLLAVTPYYNKGTEDGILKYYEGISNASVCGVIAYNVPTRTGYSITPSLYGKLCDEGFICGIKEAKNDMAEVARTFEICGNRASVYSGNDNLLLPFLSLGGAGCISVASNIVPKVMKEIYSLYVCGEREKSIELFFEYLKLMDELFSVVNPVPVKRCIELMGLCDGEIRLPLTPYKGNGMEKLLKEYELI
jgi:4-hydroxy-tetrahydrodipicolinate synthase